MPKSVEKKAMRSVLQILKSRVREPRNFGLECLVLEIDSSRQKKKLLAECSHGDGVSRRGCIVDILGSIECNLHTLNYCRMGLQNLI